MVVEKKKVYLTDLQIILKSLELDSHIASEYRLLYFTSKIQKALQEVIDIKDLQNETYDTFLEKPYGELLLYCLQALKLENITIGELITSNTKDIDDTNIYSLSEYAVRRFDFSETKINNTDFKSTIKSILFSIVESLYYDKITKNTPWN